MEIKRAKIKDLEEIQRLSLLLFKIESENWDKSLNLHWTFGKEGRSYFRSKILKNSNCAFIAVENDKIVGYLVGGLIEAEDYRTLARAAELDNIFVMEEYRDLKVGTKLYNEFIKWCKSKDVRTIRVKVSAENIKAINFYKRNNFKEYCLTLEQDI